MALVAMSAVITCALVCGIALNYLMRRFLVIRPQKRIRYARGKL